MCKGGYWDVNLFAHYDLTRWVEEISPSWVIIYLPCKIRIINVAQFAPRLLFFDVSLEDGLISFPDFRVEG